MSQEGSLKPGMECHKFSTSKAFNEGLKLFGDMRTLFVISKLAEGEMRFCEIQRKTNNMNPVTLTNRLKKLESLGFIKRKEEAIDKLSVSYSLTKKGMGMVPVIESIEAYAKDHL